MVAAEKSIKRIHNFNEKNEKQNMLAMAYNITFIIRIFILFFINISSVNYMYFIVWLENITLSGDSNSTECVSGYYFFSWWYIFIECSVVSVHNYDSNCFISPYSLSLFLLHLFHHLVWKRKFSNLSCFANLILFS